MYMKRTCDRCHKLMESWSMSYMNEDIICPTCKEKERMHPRYNEAKEAELDAVKKGDMNYPGLFAGMSYEEILL